MGYLQDMTADAFSAFVWYMLTRNVDQDESTKLRARLWRQPKGQVVTDPRSPWSRENEGAAFAAFKAQIGV